MQSEKLPDLPIPTCDASAVMINDHIYVFGGLCRRGDVDLARQVQVYDVNSNVWRRLPPSPQYDCQGLAIDGKLVLIGGFEAASEEITNLVSTWTGQGWQQDPPMPTKRYRPGVTTYHTFVVVAGGRAKDNRTLLSSIDILNITERQWSALANLQLPQPMYDVKCAIFTAHLCVASAHISYDADTDSRTTLNEVWQLPVTALAGDDDTTHQWTTAAPTPYYNSAILQDTAHIVAVGGNDDISGEPKSDIFVYNPDRDVRSKVGQLGVSCARCAVVSLNRTSFIVFGGCTNTRDPFNTLLPSVEMVHV